MELTLPPDGWTLAEAAVALLPNLFAPAAQPPPENWWMAGGAEPHGEARAALRLAFARRMEAADLVAEGLPREGAAPVSVPPQSWRAAQFRLSLPGEPDLLADVCAGGKMWHGVRIRKAEPAFDVDLGRPRIADGERWQGVRIRKSEPALGVEMGRPCMMALVQAQDLSLWLMPMAALALLITGDPAIAAEAQPKLPGAQHEAAPPHADDVAPDEAGQRRAWLGSPAEWKGLTIAWLAMWAGSAEAVTLAQGKLVNAVQAGSLRSLGRLTEDEPYLPLEPAQWAATALLDDARNPLRLVVARHIRDGTWHPAADLADVLLHRDDVLAILPGADAELPPVIVSTGAQGRPTSMHLIQPEHRRRLDAGEAHDAVGKEARHLAAWFSDTHPKTPQPTPKAIENVIRAAHRQNTTRSLK